MRARGGLGQYCYCLFVGLLVFCAAAVKGDQSQQQQQRPFVLNSECREIGGSGSFVNDCIVSNSKQWSASTTLKIVGEGNLTLAENVTLSIDANDSDNPFSADGEFNITLGGSITLLPGASLRAPTIILTSTSIFVHERASVNASGLSSNDNGKPYRLVDGAGYGGKGAVCDSENQWEKEDTCYGWKYDFTGVNFPFTTIGGGSSSAGSGGGRIMINTNGNITLAGAIESDGLGLYSGTGGGGGSGGSITINSVGIISNSSSSSSFGSAVISASGGPGTLSNQGGSQGAQSGGGGGGRIAVRCTTFDSNVKLAASGGMSTENCTYDGKANNGGAGTIFLSEAYVDQLHISNNGKERVSTSEATYLGMFPERDILDKFIIQYDAVAEMQSDITSTAIIARAVELTSSASLLFGSTSGKHRQKDILSGLRINADTFTMANSVMDIQAGYLQYGGLTSSAGSFNLSLSSVVTIVAQTSSATSTVSKILGSVSITYGSSLISDGKIFLSPFYKDATVEIGSGYEDMDQVNIIAGSYITFMGYKNINITKNSQVTAPCAPSVSKACSGYDPCEVVGAKCPKDENPCVENIKGFWTVSFCKIGNALNLEGGLVTGSNIYVEDTPEVNVNNYGQILANYGCASGAGPGNGTGNSINGAGGGAGHGGVGGNGTSNAIGGITYGSNKKPCENGSGGGSGEQPGGRGGGSILMGSKGSPVTQINLNGKICASGQNAVSGGGGGSGGSILFYANSIRTSDTSTIDAKGGNASFVGGGGGGGGGRIHFEWIINNDKDKEESRLQRMLETVPQFTPCNVSVSGGTGSKNGSSGGGGTETTIPCPKGQTGIFCSYCPLGTYKDVVGSSQPCKRCQVIPRRANYTAKYGGDSYPCAYGCFGGNLRSDCALPNELFDFIVKIFGGPFKFIGYFWGFILVTALISGSVKSGIGKTRTGKKYPGRKKWQPSFFTPHKFPSSMESPLLESLDQVLINEESSSHESYEDFTMRIYFEGTGSVHDPWKLHYLPPADLKKGLIIESEYLKFVDDCNRITMSESIDQLGVFGILKLVCPPIAWKWKNKHRAMILENLQYFVESEEGHSFLRSARSRALLDVLRFGHSPDLTLAYFDLHISIHELQSSIKNARRMKSSNEEILHQKLPMVILFAGEGSFLSPYNVPLQSSDFLQQFLCETLSPVIWAKLIQQLNMQLQNTLRSTLEDDISQLKEFIEMTFHSYLDSCSMRASLYIANLHMDNCQIGLFIESMLAEPTSIESNTQQAAAFSSFEHTFLQQGQQIQHQPSRLRRKVRIISRVKKLLFCAHASFSGPRMQATLGLLIFLLVSFDGCVTLYLLIEVFALKELFVLSLVIPPLSILACPLNGMLVLFHQSRKELASAVRLQNIWNMCSMISVMVILAGELFRTITSYNFDHIPWYHSQSTLFFLVPLALLFEKVACVLLVNIFAASVAQKKLPN